MKQINALIVDDEKPARVNLRKAVEPYENWRVVGELDTGELVVDTVQSRDVDVVFLDIKMPRRDGMSVLKELAGLERPPLVVFVTAYDQHAVEAFEFFALDYLLKPFGNRRIEVAIRRAETVLKSDESRRMVGANQAALAHQGYVDRIVIKSTGSLRIVDTDDIHCFKASGNYVEIFHSGGVALHRTSLAFLERKLDPEQFIRTHRSAIVRIREIRQIEALGDEKYRIRLKNDECVPLSGTYRDALYEKLGAF